MRTIKHFFLLVIKFFVKIYFLSRYDVDFVYGNFDPKKDGPYFLIGNHVLLMDAIFSNLGIKGYAVPVTNSFAYFGFLRRLALNNLIDSIVKRKGQSDIQTIKDIIKHVKMGDKISLYPEGNASYYGSNSDTVFSTAKLFKKLKVDVVSVLTQGGYLSKPRWRDKRLKKGKIVLTYSTLLTKEQLQDMTIEEINDVLIKGYEFNDYQWNKVEKNKYIGKNRLVGAERLLYGCPKCLSIDTMVTSGDTIRCSKCDLHGEINDFGFLNNLPFDNISDWGMFQEDLLRNKKQIEIKINCELFEVDFDKYKFNSIIRGTLSYNDRKFIIESNDKDVIFDFSKIKGTAFSEADQFSFDYEEKTYTIVSNSPKLLLDLTKNYKEEL
jgi:1-acyl-sn-glycerol-3-phosphate acyltransferase